MAAASKQSNLAFKTKQANPVHQLPTAFPARADMPMQTQKWVQQIRALTDEATEAVLVSQSDRTAAQRMRRAVTSDAEAKASKVDAEVKRKTDELQVLMKKISSTLNAHERELTELLALREKATAKLAAVKKPLADIQRRMVHRGQNIPNATEAENNAVDMDLRQAAFQMNAAVDHLVTLVQTAERHAAHMGQVRDALRLDYHDRNRAVELTDLTSGGATRLGSSTRSGGNDTRQQQQTTTATATAALPPMSPRSLRWNQPSSSQDGGHLSPRGGASPKRGASSPSAPESPRNFPKAVMSNTRKCLEMSGQSVAESAQLRQRMQQAMKQVNATIATNSDAVEKSIRRQVEDTKALQVILHDRLSVTKQELARVEGEIARLSKVAESMEAPLETAHRKFEHRRVEGKGMRDAQTNDPLAVASGEEIETLRRARGEHARHLGGLLQQRTKLLHLIEQLQSAAESKSKLLSLDLRVLQIGHTPAPPSGLGFHQQHNNPPSSGRSTATSSRRSVAQRFDAFPNEGGFRFA